MPCHLGDLRTLKATPMPSKLEQLISFCEQQGYTVKFVDTEKLRDFRLHRLSHWLGMNPIASKDRDVNFKYGRAKDIPHNELWVDNSLPLYGKYSQFETLQHELAEPEIMELYGIRYKPAHMMSLKEENIPLKKFEHLYVVREKALEEEKGTRKQKKMKYNISGVSKSR